MEESTFTTFLLAGTFFVSVFLHNFMSGLVGIEEALFFFLALVSAFMFPLSIFYNVYTYVARKEPRDIWKLGYLGLIGILGILESGGRYSFTFFYAFFGLFAFFGLKK